MVPRIANNNWSNLKIFYDTTAADDANGIATDADGTVAYGTDADDSVADDNSVEIAKAFAVDDNAFVAASSTIN